MRHLLMIGVLFAFAAAAGCASSPALRTEPSASAIRAAEEVGAADVPLAALHLQLAREQVERAESLAAEGKQDEAASQLLRAEADAELALALSHEEAERSAAAKAIERVLLLQQNNR